ncbi:hypothetical protein RRG08_005837 [Elysia crispata]|uniref:Uncharacterized protein n=1 Tax=Elysia crispata TaxID=231223 RepID=A0AAE1ATZ9_9GAST|nr:hypothetical protein RRG08_005837 [Elysia crispata]
MEGAQEHDLPQTSRKQSDPCSQVTDSLTGARAGSRFATDFQKTVRSLFPVTDSFTALGPSFSHLRQLIRGRSTKSGIAANSDDNYVTKHEKEYF